MARYMASNKGRTAGSFGSPREAARDFFMKYPDEKSCSVAIGSDAGDLFIARGSVAKGVTPESVDKLDGPAGGAP